MTRNFCQPPQFKQTYFTLSVHFAKFIFKQRCKLTNFFRYAHNNRCIMLKKLNAALPQLPHPALIYKYKGLEKNSEELGHTRFRNKW
jgi:hypothetical protein